MSFVRISLMTPKAGGEARVHELLLELTAFHQQQDGFLGGYTLTARSDDGETGRITVWADEEYANKVAVTDQDLSLRSELNLVTEPGSHRESSFEGVASLPGAAIDRGIDR